MRNGCMIKKMMLTLLVSGCSSAPTETFDIAPFSDRPNEIYQFSFEGVVLPVGEAGTVWMCEPNGEYVDFGGPVGTFDQIGEHGRIGVGVVIRGMDLDLQSTNDVAEANPREIEALFNAAEQVCNFRGYDRDDSGFGVNTQDGVVNLIGICRLEE